MLQIKSFPIATDAASLEKFDANVNDFLMKNSLIENNSTVFRNDVLHVLTDNFSLEDHLKAMIAVAHEEIEKENITLKYRKRRLEVVANKREQLEASESAGKFVKQRIARLSDEITSLEALIEDVEESIENSQLQIQVCSELLAGDTATA